MPLQLGRCAYTAACTFPGPRIRLGGTNRLVCRVHARNFALAFDAPAPAATDVAAALPPRGFTVPLPGKKG